PSAAAFFLAAAISMTAWAAHSNFLCRSMGRIDMGNPLSWVMLMLLAEPVRSLSPPEIDAIPVEVRAQRPTASQQPTPGGKGWLHPERKQATRIATSLS